MYLWIQDGKLEIRDANHIWGQDTYQSQDSIIKELKQPHTRVAAIGPAGEKLLGYAGIFCDHGRTAGRTGLGAVMGSKNVKAIAVQGSGKIPLAHPELFSELRSQVNRDLKNDNQSQVLHDLGTAGVANYSEYLGAMPSKYFHQGAFPEVDDVSGARMADTILVGKKACHGCVIACGRVVDIGDGVKRKGPEYETVVALGSNLLIHDLKAIVKFNEICDRAGMDTISVGNTLGLAFTLFEKGIITTKETGGLKLEWGDSELVQKLLGMIVPRKGFGAILAEGSRALGKHFGAEDEAVQVNGLEVAAHDPRGASGMALVYATSPRGACHNQSDYFFVDWGHTETELGIEFLPRQDGPEKAANVARHQDWRTVHNALVMCILATVPPQAELDLINAATGYQWTFADMMRCGERGWNLKRLINLQMGLTAKDDCLPKPLLEPYPTGGAAGYKIDFPAMLDKYYETRGWDKLTGRPTEEKLTELGLAEFTKLFE